MVLGITFSPKMPRKTKDLYMTKNHTLAELNKIVDAKTEVTRNPKLLLKTGDKLYDEAQKAFLDGDEERAYVLFMRFFEVTKTIQKSEEYKKDQEYYKKMLGPKRINESITKCKALSDTLKARYTMMQQANEIDSALQKKEVSEALANEKTRKESKDAKKIGAGSNSLTPGSNGIVKPPIEDEAEKDKVLLNAGVITVKHLKNLVDQKSTRFLAIDCRSKHDFTRGRIIHSNCISIPSDILQPGMSANQLEKKLKELHPESYMNWVKRGTFDQIVLYDWNSSFENQQPAMSYLYAAMTKWDPETIYKAPPAVLMGGMKNLYFSYPTLITQPQNVSEDSKKVDPVATPVAKNLDSISYPTWDDDEFSSRSKSSSPSQRMNNELPTNGLNPKNSANNNSFPDHNLPKEVTVDRSTKPKSFISNISNGTVNHIQDNNISIPSGSLVNGKGSAKTAKFDLTDMKREAVNAALDDIIRSTKEVSKNEEKLSELQSKASSSANEAIAAELKNKENEVIELRKQLLNKDEDFSMLERDYKALIERDRSKSTFPQIRPSESEVKIQEKMKTKRELDEYVNKLREERKKKENERIASVATNKLPVISSPKTFPTPRVSSSASTPFPTINSTPDNQTGVKPSNSGGGLLRPMSQDASPLTNLKKLKDDSSSDSPRSSLLKRSHSHPNIAQSINEEDISADSASSQTPNFNRTLKPSASRPYVPETFTPTRTREFHAVNSTERHKTGLKNLGNTCYMNSIMQCINHLTSLVEYLTNETFKSHLKKDRIPTKGDITLEVSAAIKEMNYGHRSIALNDFKNVVGRHHPSFRGTEQQDSHEFLTILLDCLHEELNRVPTKMPLKEQKNDDLSDGEASQIAWNDYCASNLSKISELFCGQQKSCVKCQSCGKESVTFEPFFILSVPIPGSNRKVDVQQCIDLYTSEEEVAGWNCVYCKSSGKATKKIDLWKLPPYLIIHLQRFYSDGYWKKRLTEVEFPVDNLDLTAKVMSRPYSQDIRVPRLNFQLNGVSNHYGTMDGGHYTAYCRKQGTQWCKFDDHEVYPINSRDVCTPAAYILFYCNISP